MPNFKMCSSLYLKSLVIIILSVHFLNDFSIAIHPRDKMLTLTSVEGNSLKITTELKKKYPVGETG